MEVVSGVRSGEWRRCTRTRTLSLYLPLSHLRAHFLRSFSSWGNTCASLPLFSRLPFTFFRLLSSYQLPSSFRPHAPFQNMLLLVLSVRGKRLSGLCVKATGSDSRSALVSVPPPSHVTDSISGQSEKDPCGSEGVIGEKG